MSPQAAQRARAAEGGVLGSSHSCAGQEMFQARSLLGAL